MDIWIAEKKYEVQVLSDTHITLRCPDCKQRAPISVEQYEGAGPLMCPCCNFKGGPHNFKKLLAIKYPADCRTTF